MPLYQSYSDADLVKLMRHSDHSAYRELYDRFWGLLYQHALRMIEDQDLAKDIIQDVFLSIWTKREDLEFRVSVSAFLYASVRNACLNHIDHSRVRKNYMDALQQFIDEGEDTTGKLVDEKELAIRIEAELARLPEKMRKVFELSRFQDYSYREIAEELKITDHTVKKQMSNALRILRSKFRLLFNFF